MINIREANEDDITAIGELFTATYKDHYAHAQFYHPQNLKKLIFFTRANCNDALAGNR